MSIESHITLRQGLQKFYQMYDSELSHKDEGIPDGVSAFFKSHDIAHVLFACDISLRGEGSVKIWTAFGTTLGFWNHITEYRRANAFDLSKNLKRSSILFEAFRFIVSIPSLIIRVNKMHKKWPWSGYQSYLDRPIFEIRKEFNIEV